MARSYELTWINKHAEQGPIFKIGRDIYERDRPGERVIRLNAVESYPARVSHTAIDAFTECAQAWGAPIVFIICPDLKKPPAVRFLFEWSRTTHGNGSVERCYMKTGNRVTHLMGRVVLRAFTDGSMPFEAVRGEDAVQARLGDLELDCPRAGFEIKQTSTALVRREDAPPSLLRSLFGRAARKVGLGRSS